MKSKNFDAGIHILAQKDGKYLLLRKSSQDKDEPNHWDLPGGGIEFGEQPFEAAVREAKEEAGVKVKIIKILVVWAMPYKKKWSIEFLVKGKYLSGKVRLSPEHSDYKWVSRQELTAVRPKNIILQALVKFWRRN